MGQCQAAVLFISVSSESAVVRSLPQHEVQWDSFRSDLLRGFK
jgi:hypothetical protein